MGLFTKSNKATSATPAASQVPQLTEKKLTVRRMEAIKSALSTYCGEVLKADITHVRIHCSGDIHVLVYTKDFAEKFVYEGYYFPRRLLSAYSKEVDAMNEFSFERTVREFQDAELVDIKPGTYGFKIDDIESKDEFTHRSIGNSEVTKMIDGAYDRIPNIKRAITEKYNADLVRLHHDNGHIHVLTYIGDTVRKEVYDNFHDLKTAVYSADDIDAGAASSTDITTFKDEDIVKWKIGEYSISYKEPKLETNRELIRQAVIMHVRSVRPQTGPRCELQYADGVLHALSFDKYNKTASKQSYASAAFAKLILMTYDRDIYNMSVNDFNTAYKSFDENRIIIDKKTCTYPVISPEKEPTDEPVVESTMEANKETIPGGY